MTLFTVIASATFYESLGPHRSNSPAPTPSRPWHYMITVIRHISLVSQSRTPLFTLKNGSPLYLLEAAPPAVRNSGLHPPGQSQQLVVSLSPLGLLLPPLLAVLRVRLVLPLQAAPLAGLRRPLGRSATPVIAVIVFSAVAGGRRATVIIVVVFAPQERALPAGRVAKRPLKYTIVPYFKIKISPFGISAGRNLSHMSEIFSIQTDNFIVKPVLCI